MSSVTIYSTLEKRTPEQEYKNAARIWHEVSASRDETQQQLDTLDLDSIYRLVEMDALSIRRVEVLKATPKQYRVRYMGHTYTLSRTLIDSGAVARNDREQFASGSTIRPMLQQQLEEQSKAVERCASRMEEKRLALESNQL
jgi:hypothetical protein